MRPTALIFVAAVMLAQAPKEHVIRTTTSEVLLDLVVRDKGERFVRDLKPEDIEVYENGVRQRIKTFEFVDGRQVVRTEAEAAGAAPRVPPAPIELNPLRQINLVSIIFGALDSRDPQVRLNAQKVARQFLEQQLGPNTYAAVFSLDYRLNLLQPYTNDPELLRKAVDHAATGAYSQFIKESLRLEQRLGVGAFSGAEWSARDTGRDMQQGTLSPTEAGARMDAMLRDIMLANLIAEQYQASIRALLSINQMVQEQSRFPGRKTVLMIAEGLPGHPDTNEIMQTAISNANRNNVSIYGLDPRGLTTSTGNELARSLIGTSVSQSQSVATRASDEGVQLSTLALEAKSSDIALLALFANRQEILRDLADGTGGFLIANTNEFRKPLRKIFEDVKTHYELSYTPANTEFDGHWRAVSIKVNRPGVKVQTRSGYFGLPLMFGRSLMPFEIATLKALDTRPLPHQFDYAAAAVRFRPGASSVQHSLVIEVPIRNLKVVQDAETKTCKTRVSVTALIKNGNGEVINKISREAPRTAPLERIEDLRRDNIIVTAPFALAPGRYTLETAVIDRESLKTSAARSALIVPANAGLGLSEVSLVRRLTPVGNAPAPGDPFQSQMGNVTPTLASNVTGAELSLYGVVYPVGTVSAKPEVMIEIQRDGKPIARAPVSLRPADESGATRFLVTIPTARLAPGDYEARIIARQGTLAAQEMTTVTVQRGM